MKNNFTIQEVIEFWDSVAEKYESTNETVGYVHYQRYEFGVENLSLESGHKVLNIWSRMGGCIPYIKNTKKIDLYNREVSPKFLEIAKKKFPKENFGFTDLDDLSEFGDNFFDRIISLETLEHAPNPLVFLKELNRVLKPGGLLVMSLPPSGAEWLLRVWELFFDNHGEGPHKFLSAKDVKNLLKKSNFMLKRHKPSFIFPFGFDRLERTAETSLNFLFGKTPLANFAVRHFYVCKKI
jgi:ubiquinone/menaquinone biosynthesis C-methylase UbiE